MQNHVVVCGYGQVGAIWRLVQEHGLPVVVIDQSESRIQQVREAGCLMCMVMQSCWVDRRNRWRLPDPMTTRLCLKRALDLGCPANHDKDIELSTNWERGRWCNRV